ncbi:glutathione S-transferase N-terminal domain-containing protein [Tahibacter amnicola]|uniref:Glutathione S-transferase N-terminal domain-containing protein n=1 Tax=Tahibacter amnicola TaxID=2976241 RepID=A0ABY6BIQ8_9GAMM|nr:glutathione S-transferase N-terminal domain-containing protein [Tahibacter amnicola]UXI67737.1 glutathione S-transferase N-terminal domain-containing protein [Tahibacter amnicola]
MIELYYWATPNGQKLRLFLEEAELAYRLVPVNIGKGEQFAPEFLAISPNNRIPALVDHDPADGGEPVSLFESGAMLLYLADKIGQFIPDDFRGRQEVLKWLFWQVGGLGPMAGQMGHFAVYAPEKVPYAIERYQRETARLYGVLDKQLAGREFIAGQYSIADMACYPWIVPHAAHGQDLALFPHLQRWFEAIRARPATQRTYAGSLDPYSSRSDALTDEARRVLFGTPARSVVATA